MGGCKTGCKKHKGGGDFSKNRANLTKMKENVLLDKGVLSPLTLAAPLYLKVLNFCGNKLLWKTLFAGKIFHEYDVPNFHEWR